MKPTLLTFWQDEVQSAHWNKKQITIFSSCFWHKDLCESDYLHHCKDSIIVFIDNILQNIVRPQDRNITELHLWSDGPNNQFKNKFIAAGWHWLETGLM